MRLDLYLTKYFNIQSRNKANELIKSKKVKVNDNIILKASYIVDEHSQIKLLEEDFYVSRAAYKLKYFLEEFNINIKNKNALDIGSSTGGFTQILLEKQIKSITCVDVGSKQLHEKIKNDKRITFFENQDIRTFKSSKYFDVVSCDVSFISILNIIESIHNLTQDKIIILFKPQFEVGNNIKRNKKGKVENKQAILQAREKFLKKCKELNWKLINNAKSKIEGKNGNEEEFFYFSK